MAAQKFNDRVIEDGFPKGWFIQDRLDSNEALLICHTPGMWPGTVCVCVRPRAMLTDEWLPMARRIASLLEADQRRRVDEALKDVGEEDFTEH
jgi:hypothetical protein